MGEEPEATEVETLAVAEPADAGPEMPDAMQEPDALAAPAQAEAPPPQDRPDLPPPSPVPASVELPTDMPAPAALPTAPVRAAPSTAPEIALDLPESPLAKPLPPKPEARLREAEPEPEPDQNEAPEIEAQQAMVAPEAPPELETAADRPVAPARPAALTPPEAVAPTQIAPTGEPEPEPMPAPTVAILPPPKPEPREAARPAAQPPQTPREPKPEPARQPKPEPAPAGGGWDSLQQSASPLGAGGAAQAGVHSAADIENARQGWLAEVRRAVQREKKYPQQAQRRGIEGQPTVRITLDASGLLVGARLAGSSGEVLLDEAAMAAVRSVGRYPPIPPEMREASVAITLPFEFRRR